MSTRGYQQISCFQCITFALSDVVNLSSKLGPLSRIWQETCMSQYPSMHLNRILDTVALGTAMKYIFSCTFFFKTCTALQVDSASMTEVQCADIFIMLSLSRSTCHVSSSCISVLKSRRWLVKSAEVGCRQAVHSVLIGICFGIKRSPGTGHKPLPCLYASGCSGSDVSSGPMAQY